MKICVRCKKNSDRFSKDKRHRDGLASICSKCDSDRKKPWRNSAVGIKSQANAALKYKYGISLEEKKGMMDEQFYLCANKECNYKFKHMSDAKVDHRHSDGKIRKLLCVRCNAALGMVKENPNIMYGLSEYIKQYNG